VAIGRLADQEEKEIGRLISALADSPSDRVHKAGERVQWDSASGAQAQ
jgi:hypothetical protein